MYNDCELKKMIVEVCELLETQDIYTECKEYIDHNLDHNAKHDLWYKADINFFKA